MKKLSITLLLSLLVLTGMTASVFADPFTPSVSYKHDVGIIGGQTTEDGHSTYIKYKSEEDNCDVDVVVTPYFYIDDIKDIFTGTPNTVSQIELKQAYEDIKSANEVTDFAPALIGKGLPFNIEDTCMVVSNLFDVSTYHKGEHDSSVDHRKVYNLKIGADSLEYFMYLIHYDAAKDIWEIVPGAYVSGENRDTLTFSYDCCSPFAIITCGANGNCQYNYACAINASGDDYKFPVTGVIGNNANNSGCNCILHFGGHCYCFVLIILLIVSLILNVYFLLKSKEDDR